MKREDSELTDFDLKEMLSAINSTPKYVWIWWDIENFFINWLSPNRWYRRIKFFLQRLIRGFDDSETWEMDMTFFNWIYPRLKRFKELSNGYPEEYESFEDWIKELDKRIIQLERIINIDIDCFPYHEYLKKSDIEEITKIYGKKIPEQMIYNNFAYNACQKDFLEWFKNNLNKLWW